MDSESPSIRSRSIVSIFYGRRSTDLGEAEGGPVGGLDQGEVPAEEEGGKRWGRPRVEV